MRYVAVLALVLVLLLANAGRAQTPGTIVPGKLIGPFMIGMPMELAIKMVKALGPSSDRSDDLGAGWCNDERGFCVYDNVQYSDGKSARTPGRVAFIGTDDSQYQTSDGVGVGFVPESSEFARQFNAYMGSEPNDVSMASGYLWVSWDSLGLRLVLRSDVAAVHVFAPEVK